MYSFDTSMIFKSARCMKATSPTRSTMKIWPPKLSSGLEGLGLSYSPVR